MTTLCTNFQRNRPTFISKSAPVSQAEALKRLAYWVCYVRHKALVLGLPRPVLCLVLVSLDCELLEHIFLSRFSRENWLYRSFSCQTMLLVPVQYLDNTFFYLSFAQSCKMLSKSSNRSAILKHRGKTLQ